MLSEKGLIEESEGARVIFVEGVTRPLIVVKKDGGYNYASTDLTALWFVSTFSFCFLMTTHYFFSVEMPITLLFCPFFCINWLLQIQA